MNPRLGLFDLRGKVVLVTGATGGMGLAIAQAMAAHGATLVVSDRDAAATEALAAELSQGDHECAAFAADLGRTSQVKALADAAWQRHGRIDALVCNAGVQGPAGPIGQITDADWEQVMGINLRSAMTLTSSLLPRMAEQGGGSATLMSSIAGLRGNQAIGLYGLSKAALAQLARNLAVEWGPRNVRVNAISPGVVRTPLAARLIADEAFMQRRLSLTPLRRVGEPHEVAGVAVMLASVAGGFITGQNLVVDGGTMISDGS